MRGARARSQDQRHRQGRQSQVTNTPAERPRNHSVGPPGARREDHHAESDDYQALLAQADAPASSEASSLCPFLFSSDSPGELCRNLDKFFFTIRKAFSDATL